MQKEHDAFKDFAIAKMAEMTDILDGDGATTGKINTIVFHSKLSYSSSVARPIIDLPVFSQIAMDPDIIEYNNRVLGWQPEVGEISFNVSKSLAVSKKGQLSKNKIHAKVTEWVIMPQTFLRIIFQSSFQVFKQLSVQVTGPTTMQEILGVSEYLRGYIASVLMLSNYANPLLLHTLTVDNINYGIKLGMSLKREELAGKLKNLESHGEDTWKRCHTNVELNAVGKEGYAAIKISVHTPGILKPTKVMIFGSGYIMIMAKDVKSLTSAIKYICDLAPVLKEFKDNAKQTDIDEDEEEEISGMDDEQQVEQEEDKEDVNAPDADADAAAAAAAATEAAKAAEAAKAEEAAATEAVPDMMMLAAADEATSAEAEIMDEDVCLDWLDELLSTDY